MPDNLSPMRCSQDRFGASSISLTRSVKYVGWLLGSSIGPVNLYCGKCQPVPVTLGVLPRDVEHTLSCHRFCCRNCRHLALRSSSFSADGL